MILKLSTHALSTALTRTQQKLQRALKGKARPAPPRAARSTATVAAWQLMRRTRPAGRK